MANVQNLNVEKKDGAQVEITGEITADAFESNRASAVQKIADETEIEGFRKGKAPEDVLIKKLGEMPILEEMAERALGKEYPNILLENKIDAIGRPDVQITKIAKGEPLGFKITSATMPEVSLGDYKKAAVEKMGETEEVAVEDSEVEEVIQQVRTQYGQQQAANDEQPTTDDEQPATDNEGNGEEAKSKDTKKKDGETPSAELPELTDEFVQSLGDFKDVADFRAKVKENVKKEKEQKAKQKKRIETMEAIIKDSKIEVPEMLVQEEVNKMMHQFENDVSRMGLKFEEYLKHVSKSRDEMRKEWRPDAEKNAKVQLILNKIAVEEDIHPNKERVEEEVKKIMDMYKDASEDRARNYVETILTNEAVFDWLEQQKGGDE